MLAPLISIRHGRRSSFITLHLNSLPATPFLTAALHSQHLPNCLPHTSLSPFPSSPTLSPSLYGHAFLPFRVTGGVSAGDDRLCSPPGRCRLSAVRGRFVRGAGQRCVGRVVRRLRPAPRSLPGVRVRGRPVDGVRAAGDVAVPGRPAVPCRRQHAPRPVRRRQRTPHRHHRQRVPARQCDG